MTEQHQKVKKYSQEMVLLWLCCENGYLECRFLRVYSLKQHQGFIEEVCGRHCHRCIFLTFIRYVLQWVFCSKWARSVCLKKKKHFEVRKHTTVCICHVWACMVTRGGQRQITSLHKSRPLMSNWHLMRDSARSDSLWDPLSLHLQSPQHLWLCSSLNSLNHQVSVWY